MDQLIGSVAAAFDRAATAAAYAPLRRARRRNRSEGLSHDERLEALASMAASQEAIVQPFFREPRPLEISSWQRLEGTAQGPQVVDIRWRSDASTHLPELAERYHRGAENRQDGPRTIRGVRDQESVARRPR